MRLLNARAVLANSAAAAVLAGGLAISAAPAQAMPGAQPLPLASAQPEVTLVSGGCGPYRHRGPWGGCRPNWGGGGFYRPYGYYRPYGWGGPYGWHRGWGWRHW